VRPNEQEMEFLGASGTPPPDDPIFTGRVIVNAGNKVPSEYDGMLWPRKNVPDNKEFREKLKACLAERWGVTDEQFAQLEDTEWKTIKRIENFIYYERGLVDDNVKACACYLGFYDKNAIK